LSVCIFTGCGEPLLVKFADGGNKKKTPQTTPGMKWGEEGVGYP